MRALATLFLFLISLLTAGCDWLEPGSGRIREACGNEPPEQTMERAYAGDLDAIDCEIVRVDVIYLESSFMEPDATYSTAWRYLRWVVTGEQPDDIFELAAQSDPVRLRLELASMYFRRLEAAGIRRPEDPDAPVIALADGKGCLIRPPRLDRLLRAAPPSPELARCEDATGGLEGY